MRPGPGRPKGSLNKVTVEAKRALELAFQGIGGVEALTEWAKGNPTEFYRLWAKLVPQRVTAEVEHLTPEEKMRRAQEVVERAERERKLRLA